MKQIGGYLFYRDENRLLSFRKSWRGYVVGCAFAAAVVLATLLFIFVWFKGEHTFYVGGGGRVQGTPVAPANQTWWQFTQASVCPALFSLPCLIFAVAYFVWGSEEQRNPFTFDRQGNCVRCGKKELCNMSAVVEIRLVEAPGGKRAGRRTGIFARLKGSPWSIELGCFKKFHTARRFAQEISEFLNVRLIDDPIVHARRHLSGRGFEAITQTPNDAQLPKNHSSSK